jgi:hypothetical protein
MAIFHSSWDYLATKSVPEGRFEIDFSGSGGALSNGTVTLSGYDFTLGGVGSSYSLYLAIPAANLLATYDGQNDAIELVADVVKGNWHQNYTLFGIKRSSIENSYQLGASNVGFWNLSGWYYRSTGEGWHHTSLCFDGSVSFDQIGVPYATMDPTRIGLIAAGRGGISSAAQVTTGLPARVQRDAGGDGYVTSQKDSATPVTPNPFGPGDYIVVQIYKYSTSGGTVTTTATQTASGITLVAGTSEVTIKKLYIYFGTPDIT